MLDDLKNTLTEKPVVVAVFAVVGFVLGAFLWPKIKGIGGKLF